MDMSGDSRDMRYTIGQEHAADRRAAQIEDVQDDLRRAIGHAYDDGMTTDEIEECVLQCTQEQRTKRRSKQ